MREPQRRESPSHEQSGAEPPRPEPDEEKIRERAYLIWVEEGRPEGRHVDHWLRARWEAEHGIEPK